MKNRLIISVLFILVVASLLAFSRSSSGEPGLISPAAARERLAQEPGIVLLDVRTAEEYREKHIPKSLLLPLDVLEKEVRAKIPAKETVIFVYCRSGRRSAAAAKLLNALGYQQVFDLGGIIDWPYETETGQ